MSSGTLLPAAELGREVGGGGGDEKKTFSCRSVRGFNWRVRRSVSMGASNVRFGPFGSWGRELGWWW